MKLKQNKKECICLYGHTGGQISKLFRRKNDEVVPTPNYFVAPLENMTFVLLGKKSEVTKLVGTSDELRMLCYYPDPVLLETVKPSDYVVLFRSNKVAKSRRKSAGSSRTVDYVYRCYHATTLKKSLDLKRELPDTREPVSHADYVRIHNFLATAVAKPTFLAPPPGPPSLAVSYHGQFFPSSG